MSDFSGTHVSVSFTTDHMVYVSDVVIQGKATTTVSIVPKAEDGSLPTSFDSAVTVLVDATAGSLTIQTPEGMKVTT